MSDYQIIVLVCLLGIVGEAVRIIRPGQVLFTSGLTGLYRCTASRRDNSGGSFRIHLAPILASGPTFRIKEGDCLDNPLDVQGVKEAVEEVLRSSRWVAAGSQVLLFHLVVIVPLVLLGGVVPHGWKVLGGSLAVIQVFVAVTFTLAHRKLHPGQLGDRIQHLVSMFFFPPDGVFAADHLANRTLDAFHPLAAALVLCGEDEGRKVAGEYLRVWQNPLAEEGAGKSGEYLEKVKILVDEMGWSVGEVAGPPLPDAQDSLAYCPRCHAQFLVAEGSCPDCPGVSKVLFEDF
jgi:hypothetical protein